MAECLSIWLAVSFEPILYHYNDVNIWLLIFSFTFRFFTIVLQVFTQDLGCGESSDYKSK